MGVRLRVGERPGWGLALAPTRGSATLELALAIVGAVIVVVLLISGIEVVVGNARVGELSRAAAREVARGDDPGGVSRHVEQALPGARVNISGVDGVTEVTVSSALPLAIGPSVTVRATSRTMTERSTPALSGGPR